MASFGFSVGDFITCLSLIRQITQALKDSHGSVADYKSFLETLKSLNQTFTTSELIYLQWQNHSQQSSPISQSNTAAMINGIIHERRQCKDLMEKFLRSSVPYTDAFLKRREKAIVRSWRKVTWLYQKEEIARLDRDLQGHMRAIQIYADALFQNQMAYHTEATESHFQRLYASVIDMKTNLSSMSESLHTTQSRLPLSLGYPWEASPCLTDNVLLCDANGRSLLIPMLFLTSPKQFHELLNIMYKGMPGQQRIIRKEYTITDEDSDGVLVHKSNWNGVIRPGVQLSLNITLQASSSWKEHHCPQCEEPTLGHNLPGKRRRCHKCQLTYRVFERERLVEDHNQNVIAISEETNSKPEITSQNDSSRPLQSLRWKDEEYLREERYFKRVHYYRDIQITKQIPVTSGAESEPKPRKLIFDELPPLHKAAATGSLAEIEELLDSGREIDSPLPFQAEVESGIWRFGGCSALHLAAFFGRLKAVELLLDRGSNVAAEDWDRGVALVASIFGGNPGIAILLLARGAEPNAKNHNGLRAIHEISRRGITWLLMLFLEYGVDLLARDVGGSTALHLAASNGHRDMVEALLQQQDISSCLIAVDNYGGTPLTNAAWHGSVPDVDGHTALHLAASKGHYEVVKILLEANCQILPDNDGETPLHAAAWNGSVEIIAILLRYGAIASTTAINGGTALHFASFGSYYEIVKLLLEANCPIVPDKKGTTALHDAAWNGCVEIVSILIENGAIVLTPDGKGETALHKASYKGHYEVAKILLDLKSPMVRDHGGEMPLHHACCTSGNEEIVRLLLENGADVDCQNDEGQSPLHLAVIQGCLNNVRQLINGGANPLVKDNNGCTPLYCASQQNDTSMVHILLELGAMEALEIKSSLGLTPLLRAC